MAVVLTEEVSLFFHGKFTDQGQALPLIDLVLHTCTHFLYLTLWGHCGHGCRWRWTRVQVFRLPWFIETNQGLIESRLLLPGDFVNRAVSMDCEGVFAMLLLFLSSWFGSIFVSEPQVFFLDSFSNQGLDLRWVDTTGMLDQLSISHHYDWGVLLPDLGDVFKKLIHFRQMSPVVRFCFENTFIHSVQRKNLENVRLWQKGALSIELWWWVNYLCSSSVEHSMNLLTLALLRNLVLLLKWPTFLGQLQQSNFLRGDLRQEGDSLNFSIVDFVLNIRSWVLLTEAN